MVFLFCFCYNKNIRRRDDPGKEQIKTMRLNEEIFTVKLAELEQQYARLLGHLRACTNGDKEAIRREIIKVQEEYREAKLLLTERVEFSRSPAVAKLAKAQLSYAQETEKLIKDQMAKDLHSEMNRAGEDETEASLLYAEYAIDFATQTMRHALLASLAALYKQIELDEKLDEESLNKQKTGREEKL